MTYSSEQVNKYSALKEKFNETDKDLFGRLESIGVIDKEVLDVGCGDGRQALLVKDMGAKHLTGIDISEKMIKLAKEKAKNVDAVEFLVANGSDMPLKDESVDIVFSNFVIHYFSDSQRVFAEIARVLKKEGYFIGTFNITDVDEGFNHLYNTNMPIRLGRGNESVVVENLIKSKEEIEKAISEAGFIIEEKSELDHPNAVVDDSYKDRVHIKKHAMLFVLKKH